IEFVIPGDWNKVIQRIGFSIADSWRQAGFNINTRQVDNGEWTTVQNTNSRNELMINWGQSCTYNANWQNSWRQFDASYVLPPDSTDSLNGNIMRVTDQRIFDLVADSAQLPVEDEQF